MLPHLLLDLPKVGGLANESGAVRFPNSRKEVLVMLAEVGVQTGILAAAQEFSHHFHGQCLGISQDRINPPLAQALSLEKGLRKRDFNASSRRQKTAMIYESRSTTHLHRNELILVEGFGPGFSIAF